MKIRPRLPTLVVISASALALGACAEDMATTGAGTATPAASTDDAPTSAMPTDTRGFVTMAASSDMFEIQSSQLAKSRGVAGEVSAFADQMIRDHNSTSAAMQSMLAGMSPAMTPPTTMTDKHQALLRRVQDAGTGSAFARAYIDAQITAHQEAVALYSTYAERGDNPTLKSFAQTTLPTLRSHLEHAQKLQTGMS